MFYNKSFYKKELPIDFSIVMAYFNRKEQTLLTLKKFNKYIKKFNFEVIIVDDNSREEEKLTDLINNYEYPIIYRYITDLEKGKNINPCVVYNRGFALTRGKIIIIQNPEVIHYTNILKKLSKKNLKNNYFTLPVISSPSFDHNKVIFKAIDEKIKPENIIEYLEKENENTAYKSMKGWYNHWKYRNENFHFCSVISKENLNILEGFDETYGPNMWYDDNEFVLRISRFLKIKQLKKQLAIHLYHLNGSADHRNQELIRKNMEKFKALQLEKYNGVNTWNKNGGPSYYKGTLI